MSRVVRYVLAADRNEPDSVKAHYYAETGAGHYWPMCMYGWNRSHGERLSILRGHGSKRGICAICAKAVARGARPRTRYKPHKTRWW